MSKIDDLANTIQSLTTQNGVQDTAIKNLTLFRGDQPTEWSLALYEPALVVLARGAKQVKVGRTVHQYDPAHYVLASVDMPLLCRVVQASPNDPYIGIRLLFDPLILGEVLPQTTSTQETPSTHGLVVTKAEPAIVDALIRLTNLLKQPGDNSYLASLLQREITYRIATGPQGARIRQMTTNGGPARRIARAITWIKKRVAESIKVEDIAQNVGLSQSAFHLHFKTVTGMTPIQFQKRLRLMEARRLMIAIGLTAAEAAHQVGYASPSQFSREYRRLFGAPPKQDVATIHSEDQLPRV